MLIVGGGAALTAIAAWLVWLAARSLRASRRARQRAKAHDYRHAHEHENAPPSF
jgi:ABC-type nickel/cobalt efflux system permease component RcnA